MSDSTVEFHANALNRAMPSGTLHVVIPLREVSGVHLLPGVATKIVAIDVRYRRAKARMYGADKVVGSIRQALAALPCEQG